MCWGATFWGRVEGAEEKRRVQANSGGEHWRRNVVHAGGMLCERPPNVFVGKHWTEQLFEDVKKAAPNLLAPFRFFCFLI